MTLGFLYAGAATLAFSLHMLLFGYGLPTEGGDGPGPVWIHFIALAVAWLLLFFVQVGCAVVALQWSHRAATNVRAFGHQGLAWSPGWAVGAWLIPYANVVLPYLVLREVWKASLPSAVPPYGWHHQPTPRWFLAWWLLWVLGGLGPMVASGAGLVLILLGVHWWILLVLVPLGGVPLFAGAFLWRRTVNAITAMQERRLSGRV